MPLLKTVAPLQCRMTTLKSLPYEASRKKRIYASLEPVLRTILRGNTDVESGVLAHITTSAVPAVFILKKTKIVG